MYNNNEELYKNKEQLYFSNIRQDIISLIKGKDLKILEVGCGNGATLIRLKEMGIAKEIVGVELNIDIISKTKALLDNVLIGNIEEMNLNYPERHFDIIIFADVLEHLVNPWKVIKDIKRYLKSSGLLIASIPNIREHNTIFNILVRGNFEYTNVGILDKTHLRFFCKKNIIALFEEDYEIVTITHLPPLDKGKKAFFNKITFNKFHEFLVTQYIVISKPIKSDS